MEKNSEKIEKSEFVKINATDIEFILLRDNKYCFIL